MLPCFCAVVSKGRSGVHQLCENEHEEVTSESRSEAKRFMLPDLFPLYRYWYMWQTPLGTSMIQGKQNQVVLGSPQHGKYVSKQLYLLSRQVQ